MNFKFDRISLEQGLSQSVVYNIFQDSVGFIWLCTQDGLNQYDGYKFKVYLNNPNKSDSIIHSPVQTIYEDDSCNLWIGSSEGALSKYDRDGDNFTNFTFTDRDKDKKISSSITAIAELDNNFLLLGTYGNGLIKFDRSNHKYEFINHHEANYEAESDFISCSIKHNEKIIFGTWGSGLIIYDLKQKTLSAHKLDLQSSNTVSRNIVRAIYKNNDGNFLIGTNCGIHEIEIAGQKVKEYEGIQEINK